MDQRDFVPARPSEGQGRTEAIEQKATETKRARGRPKGAKNKPKSLLPKELASEILLKMKDTLPPDDYDYMAKVIREGKAIAVKREVQIMFALLGRNLLPFLLQESNSKSEDEPAYLRKDVTERLKVWNSLANILHNIEKNDEAESNPRAQPILTIFERAGVDPNRLRILIGVESSGMGGSPDGNGRREIESGTIPDQLPERPLDVPNSEQEPPIRVFAADFNRDDPLSVYEEELPG